MSKNRNIFKTVLLSTVMLFLAACGGGKQVVTVDDSADYKSSRSLPPLKKPSRASSQTASSSQAGSPNIESSSATSGPKITSDEPSSAEQIALDERSPETILSQTAPPSPAIEETAPSGSNSARVISGDADNARLEIDAGFDPAWAFVSASLKSSDVTVFSRNKEAGRFSIGCGNMESIQRVKKGGWSFLKKSKQKVAEYCALSVVERRGKSLVFVLNRDNTEVTSEHSNPLFTRILNLSLIHI